tara:strand:+ start:108 stop:482 length:375 start_codon:yes stop_codon:yes gene_type:complete
MKYWMCEFHERNGEHEYTFRHIYSDKNLEDIKHEGDDHEYRILSHFFHENLSLDDEDGSAYWTGDGCRLVRFDGMTQCFKKDFKVMEMCGVYSVGKARIRWNKKDEYYEEYYEEKFRREGASTL